VKEFVFVLTEKKNDVYSVIGVYRDGEQALKEKYAIIREVYDIAKDEVADHNLDDEIEPLGVYYDLCKRILL
jgi:hypothetical protein